MSNNPTDLQDEEKEKPESTANNAQASTDEASTEGTNLGGEEAQATSQSPENAASSDDLVSSEKTTADDDSTKDGGSSKIGDSSEQGESVQEKIEPEKVDSVESPGQDANPDQSEKKTKLKIGSQRQEGSEAVLVPKAVKDAKEKENPLAAPVPEAEPVEVGPSVNELGSQWEKEAEAVLEGKSVDDLMKTAAEGADLELPVNTRIKGTVTKIHGDGVFFLLKGQYDGVLPVKQFKKEPEPGTMTDVVVNGFNSEDNLYELSLPGAAVSVGDWSDLEVGKLVEVRITGSNTGGLECSINNIRGFIPASQIDVSRVDNLGAFVNQSMECVITEANRKKKNLVLSRRAILEKELKERKKEILEQFEVGSIVEGKITKLREFGAFVGLGSGVEGLIHISKCSWHHIKHPSEVFSEGQDVSVRIEKVNKETGKIQLSHRDTIEHPWKRVSEKYPVDSTINGTVSKIADFGAFIKLETGVEGLVHISEIAHERVKSVGAVLNEGQDVEVKVLSVDPDKQKMSLSIKALLAAPAKEDKQEKESEQKQPPREMAVKKRSKPLKGGTSTSSSGNQFGLKW